MEIETIDTKSGLHARENKKSGKKDIVNKPQYNTLQFVDVREKLLDVIGKFEKKNLGVWNIYMSKKDMYPEYAREAFEQGLRDNLKWLEQNRKKILGILQAPQPKAVTPKVVVPKPPTPKPPTPEPSQPVERRGRGRPKGSKNKSKQSE